MVGKETTRTPLLIVELIWKMLPGVFWLMGKGKLSAQEPLYGVQLKFGIETISEAEGDSLAPTILTALLRTLIAKDTETK